MTAHAVKARSLYRAILRELPRRPLAEPSPLKATVRRHFAEDAPQKEQALQQVEQFVAYAQAQRKYAALLERYNPGMGMDEEERVRLTMRRVGLDAPTEYNKDDQ